jgi:hypothetical protein
LKPTPLLCRSPPAQMRCRGPSSSAIPGLCPSIGKGPRVATPAARTAHAGTVRSARSRWRGWGPAQDFDEFGQKRGPLNDRGQGAG